MDILSLLIKRGASKTQVIKIRRSAFICFGALNNTEVQENVKTRHRKNFVLLFVQQFQFSLARGENTLEDNDQLRGILGIKEQLYLSFFVCVVLPKRGFPVFSRVCTNFE